MPTKQELGPMSRMNLNVINLAVQMQTRALEYIRKQYFTGPLPVGEKLVFTDFLSELERCGHQFGASSCDCEACKKYAQLMLPMIQQISTGQLQGEGPVA